MLAIIFVAEPVLRAAGGRGLRGGRPDADPRRAHARRGPGARVLRASPSRSPPAAWAPGAALAFARGIGEFGATIMFAGSLRGVTQTLPLAIYEAFDVDFRRPSRSAPLLVLVSAAVLLVAQGARLDGALDVDIAHPLRSFELERSARGRARDASRSSGRPAPARRPCCARSRGSCGPRRAGSRSRTTLFDRARRRPAARGARASASSSRSTRSSRTCSVEANVGFGGRARVRRAARALRDRAPGARRGRASSRAASASASRSPARSRATRRCCCSTSRWPRSTRTRAPRARRAAGLLASSGCRRSSSRTTSRTRPPSPTASA